MCYQQSVDCWGGEWPVLVNGRASSACTGHKSGEFRAPVIQLSITDNTNDYREIKAALDRFIKDELPNHKGVSMFGSGSPFADTAVKLYCARKKIKVQSGYPTHILVFWDFEDESVWKRLDQFLATDVVIRSVVT